RRRAHAPCRVVAAGRCCLRQWMTRRQRNVILDSQGRFIRIAQSGRIGFGQLVLEGHSARARHWNYVTQVSLSGLGRQRRSIWARRNGGVRFYGLAEPAWWLPDKRFGKSSYLSGNHPKAYYGETAYCSSRPGANKRVSKAEFIDRNTKTDHYEA